MNDTSLHIKQLQLKTWLSKPPMERLKQMMEDNASLANFWAMTKKSDTTSVNNEREEINIDSCDFILDFSSGGINRPSGLCRVRIFRMNENNSVAVITDIGDLNTGASVTNSIERIVSKLKENKRIDNSTIIIEHYEPYSFFGHTFDLVTFNKVTPLWETISVEKVCDLCKVHSERICSLVENDAKLLKEILAKTKLILPNERFSNQKNENLNHKVYTHEVSELIKNLAPEKEFQTILKKDLSLLAEVYADPKEEYICFSEFPIGGRRADFVLFTGRSKMSVIIIEIKGANFFFSNKRGYKKINEKVNTGRYQIIEDINQISKEHYERFRNFCHNVRFNVENGGAVYNSLMGPKKHLHVDEKKEIKIFGVVIGGRIRDDLHESKIRYHEENITSNIKIESWDSWLNKLIRPEYPQSNL